MLSLLFLLGSWVMKVYNEVTSDIKFYTLCTTWLFISLRETYENSDNYFSSFLIIKKFRHEILNGVIANIQC